MNKNPYLIKKKKEKIKVITIQITLLIGLIVLWEVLSKYNIIDAKDVNENTQKADVALCVDFSGKDRLATNVFKHLQKYDAKTIVGIDHHDDKNKIVSDFNQITKAYRKSEMPEIEAKNFNSFSSDFIKKERLLLCMRYLNLL